VAAASAARADVPPRPPDEPLFWGVPLSFQRSFVSDKLGAQEPPGFDTNTVSRMASRCFRAPAAWAC